MPKLLPPLALSIACLTSTPLLYAADPAAPITVWNANFAKEIAYQPLQPAANPGDWVYIDSHKLHPTQFCLGYREVIYKARVFSDLKADRSSHDAKSSLYAYLAKK